MAGWRFHTLLSPVRALGMSGDGVGASRGPDNLETCWTPVVRFLDAQVLIATAWVAAAQGVVSEVQRLDQPSPAPRNSADSPTGAAHRRACRARRRTLDDADMSEFELPSNLARRLALHELPGSALRGWVTELPSMVERLALRWSLRLGRPFQPGGVTSWVAPARTDDGATVVLKVSWRHLEALHEVDGLRVWAGNGAVQLVDSAVLVSTTALLLEACDPAPRWPVQPPRSRTRWWRVSCAGCGSSRRRVIRSARWPTCAAGGRTNSRGNLQQRNRKRESIRVLRGPAPTCSGACRPHPNVRYFCAPTCTPVTCWPPGSRGWSSIRSPTSATRPMPRCSTCSTPRTGSSPTRPVCR